MVIGDHLFVRTINLIGGQFDRWPILTYLLQKAAYPNVNGSYWIVGPPHYEKKRHFSKIVILFKATLCNFKYLLPFKLRFGFLVLVLCISC